jgi:hypothetical protein
VQVNTSEAHAAASTLHEQSLVAQLDELADRQRYEDYYYKGDPALSRTAFARGLPAFPQRSLHRCA